MRHLVSPSDLASNPKPVLDFLNQLLQLFSGVNLGRLYGRPYQPIGYDRLILGRIDLEEKAARLSAQPVHRSHLRHYHM